MSTAPYQPLPSADSQETLFKHQEPKADLDFGAHHVHNTTLKHRLARVAIKVGAAFVAVGVAIYVVGFLCSFNVIQSTFVSLYPFKSMPEPISATASYDANNDLMFGLGIGDITGPIVEVNMMGYASLPQTNTGLHLRLRSRVFILGSRSAELDSRFKSVKFSPSLGQTADGSPNQWMFINSDICMGDTALRRAIVDRLRQLYPGLYGERNIAFVGTHSHSGPGGFVTALLPTLTSKGVIRQNFDAIVQGTVNAAVRSHQDFQDRLKKGKHARLSFGKQRLTEAHIQRSRWAYEQNPQEERDLYNDEDQDHDFALLKFEELDQNQDGKVNAVPSGFLSWYPVHGTSLYENNTFTSADNKGLAAFIYETATQPDKLPGQNTFIAGFSQSSVGDTSPNTKGAFCDDGSRCEPKHSTCDNGKGKGQQRVQTCHGRGPAWGDQQLLQVSPTGSWDFASNEMIARMQANTARQIMSRDLESSNNLQDEYKRMSVIQGPVLSVKTNIDMSKYVIKRPDGTQVTTCPAALGYGFAGGTTDGPGAFDFVQGSNSSDHHNPFWDVVKSFIKSPGKEQIECQLPKAILLDIGEIHKPYEWGPSIVEVQILQVGQLFILIAPGEFTTMAGRRLKHAVSKSIKDASLLAEGVEPIIQISGPASTYGHYITTEEEYSVQRYEGSSTLFGRHTLEAYLDIYSNFLIPALKKDAKELPQGPWREFDINKAMELTSGVVYDNPPISHSFGDVLTQPLTSYLIPNRANVSISLFDEQPISSSRSNITATFVAANPKNNLRLDSTFFEIQRYDESGSWITERTDSHHSTTLRWTRTNSIVGSSKVEIAWNIESWTKQGLYRIVYYGDRKVPFTGKIKPFTATSSEFYVTV